MSETMTTEAITFVSTWATTSPQGHILVVGGHEVTEAAVFAARGVSEARHHLTSVVLDDTSLRAAFENNLTQMLSSHSFDTVVCALPPWLSAKSENVQHALGDLATSATQPFVYLFVEYLVRRLKPLRLALVLPKDFLTSPQLGPLRELLVSTYSSLSVILCDELLEREGQIVVLGSEAKERQRGIYALRFSDLELFTRLTPQPTLGRRVSRSRFIDGRNQSMLLSETQEQTLQTLGNHPAVTPLGTLVKVREGYALSPKERTFFELTMEQANSLKLPQRYLKKAVFGSRGVKDRAMTNEFFEKAAKRGDAGYLLVIEGNVKSKPLESYLAEGRNQGLENTHAAKGRQPWYCLEPREPATLLLETSATKAPKLSFNEAEVLAADDLLELTCAEDTAKKLVQSWYNPLTEVSCELAGFYKDGKLELRPSSVGEILVLREHLKSLPLELRETLRDVLATLRHGRTHLLAS
jgi:hypothetical protein